MPDNYYSEVNEKGVVTPLRDLTAFPRSEQTVLGARQWLDKSKAVADSGTLLEQITTGIRVYNTTAKTYAAVRIPCTFKANTDYRIKADIDHTSGVGHVTLQYSDDGSTWASVIDVPKDYSADESLDVPFNSGSHAYYRLALYSTRGTSATGDVAYKNLIIVLASDDTTAYSDYAMTNEELTENKIGWKDLPTLTSSNDLDDYKKAGVYYIDSSTPTHAPEGKTYSILEIIEGSAGSGVIMQRYTRPYSGLVYIRVFNGSWQSWYKFEGTVVS